MALLLFKGLLSLLFSQASFFQPSLSQLLSLLFVCIFLQNPCLWPFCWGIQPPWISQMPTFLHGCCFLGCQVQFDLIRLLGNSGLGQKMARRWSFGAGVCGTARGIFGPRLLWSRLTLGFDGIVGRRCLSCRRPCSVWWGWRWWSSRARAQLPEALGERLRHRRFLRQGSRLSPNLATLGFVESFSPLGHLRSQFGCSHGLLWHWILVLHWLWDLMSSNPFFDRFENWFLNGQRMTNYFQVSSRAICCPDISIDFQLFIVVMNSHHQLCSEAIANQIFQFLKIFEQQAPRG